MISSPGLSVKCCAWCDETVMKQCLVSDVMKWCLMNSMMKCIEVVFGQGCDEVVYCDETKWCDEVV